MSLVRRPKGGMFPSCLLTRGEGNFAFDRSQRVRGLTLGLRVVKTSLGAPSEVGARSLYGLRA